MLTSELKIKKGQKYLENTTTDPDGALILGCLFK